MTGPLAFNYSKGARFCWECVSKAWVNSTCAAQVALHPFRSRAKEDNTCLAVVECKLCQDIRYLLRGSRSSLLGQLKHQ